MARPTKKAQPAIASADAIQKTIAGIAAMNIDELRRVWRETFCSHPPAAFSKDLLARAIVVEDAASGVQAGARGGFALVIGIARENNARELREQGADLVVTDLGETSVDDIDRLIRAKRAAAGDFQLPRDGNGSAHK